MALRRVNLERSTVWLWLTRRLMSNPTHSLVFHVVTKRVNRLSTDRHLQQLGESLDSFLQLASIIITTRQRRQQLTAQIACTYA